jgi:hypothetical protein
MHYQPEVLLNRKKRKLKISVILIDWGVRESFHSLHYLNQQTIDRDEYELIWLEFYHRKPQELLDLVACGTSKSPMLDKWIVLGYPDDYLFHKHRLYNVGILAAAGDVCVICDSDAIFRPTFLQSLLEGFAKTPNAVVHLDEVRNVNQAFYPFNYPSIEDILGPGCINWRGDTTLGLDNSPDMLHHANYGACMAARRRDLLAVGGADEDLDYLGYICGPYDLTFRLANYGRTERWLRNEYLYHTWHPNQYGWNTDYQGPHDGHHLSLLALEARTTCRIEPSVKNPWIGQARWGRGPTVEDLTRFVGERQESAWRAGAQPTAPSDRVYWIHRDYYGFDIFHQAGTWYGTRTGGGLLDAHKLRRRAYEPLWQAAAKQDLVDLLPIDREGWERSMQGASLPVRFWRQVCAQPLHRLPGRVVRKARRLLAS